VRLDLPDLVEIDDAGAMDALEAARVEAFLQILHGLAEDQGVVAGIDAHIIAGGVDLLDRIDVDPEDLAPVLDVDELLVAVGGMAVVERIADLVDRVGGDLGENLLQLLRFLDAAFLVEPRAGPGARPPPPASSDSRPPAPRRRGWRGRNKR
jgi:hypothetical protein